MVGSDYLIDGSPLMLGDRTAHPNPIFDYLSGFVPRQLKSFLKWTEYLIFNSSHIYAALNKLTDYSITEIIYDTDSSAERSRHKSLLEKTIKIKSIAKAALRDRGIYGNSFISIYFPFTRFIKCKNCNTKTNIKKLNYKFKHQNLTFSWVCSHCKTNNISHIDDLIDVKVPDPKRINVIRWDPKQMDVEYNPITGETEYYYTIPQAMKEKIFKGTKTIINTIPKGFLLAVKDNKIFKFAPDQLFHMKVEAPAGVDMAWGFPPLIATLKHFFHTAVLRKANEAIALDYLVPFRVLHPTQTTSNMDPMVHMNISKWVDETKLNIKKWRRDPLHIMFAPVALGVTQMGGNGRALMTQAEVEAEENNILACMGVPREFLFGGMTYTGSSVTLRMLENQLLSQTTDAMDLVQWIGDKCAHFLGWTTINYEMTPFKLIDDIQQKSIMLQLAQTGDISKTTLTNVFGYDLDKERKLKDQEIIDDIRHQTELNRKIQEMQTSIASQARSQAQMGGAQLQYDQQQVIAAADQLVQNLMVLDPSARRSQLQSLKSEDAVMHAVVIQRLQEMQKQQITEAKATMGPGE